MHAYIFYVKCCFLSWFLLGYFVSIFVLYTRTLVLIHCTYQSWHLLANTWKRLWCWEGLGAGGEGDDRGSPTLWIWIWVNSGSWWWTGRPGMLQFMGSQIVGHNWMTELTDWLTDWPYTPTIPQDPFSWQPHICFPSPWVCFRFVGRSVYHLLDFTWKRYPEGGVYVCTYKSK